MSQLRCALCQSSVRGAASQPWRRCYRAWYSREEIVARENARSLLPGPRGRCGPERHTKMHAHAQLADPIAAATLLSKSEVESLGSMGFVVRDNWLGEEPSNARVSSCTVRRNWRSWRCIVVDDHLHRLTRRSNCFPSFQIAMVTPTSGGGGFEWLDLNCCWRSIKGERWRFMRELH